MGSGSGLESMWQTQEPRAATPMAIGESLNYRRRRKILASAKLARPRALGDGGQQATA